MKGTLLVRNAKNRIFYVQGVKSTPSFVFSL
ncbi:unnamed protein product [Acanthoscelides obtectus]|uniref:Uncharacterized protein n=1 Tax=Acanthoscelides obtectus TaxID=200917 RepID=A0A9P0LTC2_ACAOB|nr:unnamed protein product [Acanthoscelides obtectus]CAK1655869.1 hypothetical protein AOBTE_LOCUS19403 [Acanthoscelides obtectus]